jgi:hypothetical protein
MFDHEQILLLQADVAQHEADQKTSPRRRLPEPLPSDPIGGQLCKRFPYRWQPIIAAIPEDCFQKPQWQTLTQYPLRPRTLWNLWQDGAHLVGVRFGHTTQYALIDLDALSKYHPSKSIDGLKTIRTVLEAIGIYRTIIVRSSWSGGLHLYIPLPEAIATFDLAVALKQALETQGLPIHQGQLEVFPNVKRYGKGRQYVEYNAHRLPLQPASGSVILDDDLQPVSHSLEQFFQQWDTAAAGQDMKELKQAIAKARKQYRSRSASRNDKVGAWREDLLSEIAAGWSEHGQTNHLLKTIACYGVVFEALTGDALMNYVLETAKQCSGYQQWCRHQHEITNRVKDWAIAAEGYYWPLGTNPKRTGNIHADSGNNIVPFNRQRSEDAQSRIKQAVADLKQQGELPEMVTARMKAITTIAKCSFSTLKKYEKLWHPKMCVIVVPEPETSVEQTVKEVTLQSLEYVPDKELHTKPHMKGKALSAALVEKELPSVFQGEGQGRGNDGFPQAQQVKPRWNLSLSSPALMKAISPLPSADVATSVDDVIGQIQSQIRRLGWNFGQVQQFVAQKFGGKRRSQLSDDDLFSLLYYLLELIT